MDAERIHKAGLLLTALSLLVFAGCKDNKPAPSPGSDNRPAATTPGDAGHTHERGKMLIADAGKYHALLTARLSPKGNELDVFFETADDNNPTPVAIPVEWFTAHVRREGDDEVRQVKFEPAPAEERPKGEKPGTCSHFVAKAPWMKPTDTLTVVVILNLDNERFRVTWEKFNPKKYAHHEE